MWCLVVIVSARNAYVLLSDIKIQAQSHVLILDNIGSHAECTSTYSFQEAE
jgi:hypothetical protein